MTMRNFQQNDQRAPSLPKVSRLLVSAGAMLRRSNFSVKLTGGTMGQPQSAADHRLDPNPDARTWIRHNPGNGSFWPPARRRIKRTRPTVENVCAYNTDPAALSCARPIGASGDLLMKCVTVRSRCPYPDPKHCDLEHCLGALGALLSPELGDHHPHRPARSDIVGALLSTRARWFHTATLQCASKIFHTIHEDDPLPSSSWRLVANLGTITATEWHHIRVTGTAQGRPGAVVTCHPLGKEER